MNTRLFQVNKDLAGLVKLGTLERHPALNTAADTIIVASVPGQKDISAVSAGRSTCFVHCFDIDPQSPVKRNLAHALVDYGKGLLLASGCKEMVFLVDKANAAMQEFMIERGALKEQGEFDIFCLKVE